MSAFPQCPHTDVPLDEGPTGFRTHSTDGSPCHGHSGRILQIIAAPGWRTLYADGDHENVAQVFEAPAIAFALVETCNGDRDVVALDGGYGGDPIDRADQCGNYIGLLGPGEEIGDAERRNAKEHVRMARERRDRAKAKETP